MYIPYIVVKYLPDYSSVDQQQTARGIPPGLIYENKKRCKLSGKKLDVQGDLQILKKMRNVDLIPEYDMVEILG